MIRSVTRYAQLATMELLCAGKEAMGPFAVRSRPGWSFPVTIEFDDDGTPEPAPKTVRHDCWEIVKAQILGYTPEPAPEPTLIEAVEAFFNAIGAEDTVQAKRDMANALAREKARK